MSKIIRRMLDVRHLSLSKNTDFPLNILYRCTCHPLATFQSFRTFQSLFDKNGESDGPRSCCWEYYSAFSQLWTIGRVAGTPTKLQKI